MFILGEGEGGTNKSPFFIKKRRNAVDPEYFQEGEQGIHFLRGRKKRRGPLIFFRIGLQRCPYREGRRPSADPKANPWVERGVVHLDDQEGKERGRGILKQTSWVQAKRALYSSSTKKRGKGGGKAKRD